MKRISSVLALAGVLAACGGKEATPPVKEAQPAFVPPPPIVPAPPPAPPVASAPPPRPTHCHAPGTGETSDDLTPQIGGAGAKKELVGWLDARGVTEEQALKWLGARYGLSVDHASAAFAYAPCFEAKLGDKSEEAVVCQLGIPYSLVEHHAIAIVVRNKQPSAVLDVGLGLVALDWPDARWLDLALTLAPDGKSAKLADRAPDQTKLVGAESECRAEEAHAAECEKKLAAHPNPESFATKMGNGESIAALDDCQLHRAKDGHIAVEWPDEMRDLSPGASTPATLRDCAHGRAELARMQLPEMSSGSSVNQDARRALGYFDRSCAQRGTYAWSKDRFVKR